MKKIIVHTVYYNCDDKMIEHYIEELCHKSEALKKSKEFFLKGETVNVTTEDPHSDSFGITTFKIEDQDGKAGC